MAERLDEDAPREPLTLHRGVLAAIRFRAVDALDEAVSKLEGKQVPEDGALLILVRVPVEYGPAGNPYAGTFEVRTKIHDADAEARRLQQRSTR